MGSSSSSGASAARAGARTLRAWHVGASLALTAAVVAVHALLLHSDILATLRGTRALSPLYASWDPVLRPSVLVFAVFAILLVVFAPRLCDPERTQRKWFTLALAAAAIALPFALFLVRDSASAFGWPFVFYQHEEFFEDAQVAASVMEPNGARGPLVFLRHYVELMPSLSLHGRHFPPGHAVTLAALNTFTGGNLAATAAFVLALCAAGVLAVFAALRELACERAARQGVLVCLAAPALLDFACTSMDAAFFAWAAFAWLAALRALRSGAHVPAAIVAGTCLSAAFFASFAAATLALALALHALLLARTRGLAWSFVVRQLAVLAATVFVVFVVLGLATGFSIVACFAQAHAANLAFMTHNLHGTPASRWLEVSTGNLGAFLLGAGVPLVASVFARRETFSSIPARAWSLAALATLAVMTCGGLFTLETERIWLFTLPWLAALAVSRGAWSDGALRTLLAPALAQALAQEILLFTLW